MMETNIEKKKAFALAQIKPYFKDRTLCGYSESNGCSYWTEDGKMCVAGKNLINPKEYFENSTGIQHLLSTDQSELKPESRDVLDGNEWSLLQNIHDHIATNNMEMLKKRVRELGLFTLKELKAK